MMKESENESADEKLNPGKVEDGEAGEAGEETIELKPKMTLLNGVTVIVGSIIGSGIFVSPSGVLKNTGCQSYKTFYGRNLRMFAIIQSVCPWQAFPAWSNIC